MYSKDLIERRTRAIAFQDISEGPIRYLSSHPARLNFPRSLVLFQKRGGWGVFCKNASYVVDGIGVAGCTLGGFARFCTTFGDVLARGRAAWAERCGRAKGKDKDRAGLCGLPPLP